MPLFPLLGFFLIIVFGRLLRGTAAGWLGSLAVLASFGVAAGHFLALGEEPVRETLWRWLPLVGSRGLDLSVGFFLDRISSIMTLVITGVGFLIHVFSIGYMREDPRFGRYFAFLNFFVGLMLVLVLADSYPLMFVGWEGVGLASYLLIGFWFSGRDNANAARKAFIMNRIGDLGFMLAMFLIFKVFGTLVIADVAAQSELLRVGQPALELIALFLLVGAVGKSAQLPLTTWLPDAMAGPTPVSALIHAATMVTAGVYLIARSSFLYEVTPDASAWVAWAGALTALYGALSALGQTDIKKILAFSTVSQIGYMFLAVGTGAYWAGMFHLVTHAFFKALLFLASGSVIHGLHGEQDVRKMGGLARAMPLTHAVSLIGVLAIAGIPPLAGFFSKDAVLLGAFEYSLALWIIGLVVALLTAFYMGRWYLLVFRGSYRGHAHPHEGGAVMNVPLLVLAALTVVGGFIGLPHLLGNNWLEHYLEPTLPVHEIGVSAATEWMLIGAAVLAAVIGLGLAWTRFRAGRLEDLGGLGQVSARALYLNDLYDGAVGRPSAALARGLDAMDRGVDSGISSAAEVTTEPGLLAGRMQVGYVRAYALLMLLGTVLLIGYWALRVIGGSV